MIIANSILVGFLIKTVIRGYNTQNQEMVYEME